MSDLDHRVTQDLISELVARLQFVGDDRFGSVAVVHDDGLMQMGIEAVADALEPLDAEGPEDAVETGSDPIDRLCPVGVNSWGTVRQLTVKVVSNGQKVAY